MNIESMIQGEQDRQGVIRPSRSFFFVLFNTFCKKNNGI